MPASTWPPTKKPMLKFMKDALTPPSGPRMRIPTEPRSTWYFHVPGAGRNRRVGEVDKGFRLTSPSATLIGVQAISGCAAAAALIASATRVLPTLTGFDRCVSGKARAEARAKTGSGIASGRAERRTGILVAIQCRETVPPDL